MESTPVAVLLIISMAACLAGAVFKKIYSNRSTGKTSESHFYNLVSLAVCALTLLLWGGFGACSLFTLLLGILFGAVTALQTLFTLKALEHGPLSLTMVTVMLFSTVITALSGSIVWKEEMTLSKWIGLCLMIICILLLAGNKEKQGEKKGISRTWIFYLILTVICTAGIGLMQKIHQTNALHKGELNAFLIVAFAAGTVYSLIAFLYNCKCKEKPDFSKQPKMGILLAILLLAGVAVAANNKLNLYLSGVMDTAVFFPLVNGGHLVLSVLTATLFFKERISIKQLIGAAVGVAAVVVLCL